jgi:prefoldin subunit 5
MRAISRTIYDGRPQIDERKSTYSQAVRRNLPNTETNPDAEILKGQILAIQAEMNQLRTEREKIRTLEKKVDGLEDSVNQIQNTLSNLNKGQSSTNNKLDTQIGLIQNLPSLADTGDTMEENHQEEPSDTMEEDHHEAPNPPNPREKKKQPIQTPKTPQDKHTNPYLKRLQSKNNSATPSTIKNK